MKPEKIKNLFQKYVLFMKQIKTPNSVKGIKLMAKGEYFAKAICNFGFIIKLNVENKTICLHETLGKKYKKVPLTAISVRYKGGVKY